MIGGERGEEVECERRIKDEVERWKKERRQKEDGIGEVERGGKDEKVW